MKWVLTIILVLLEMFFLLLTFLTIMPGDRFRTLRAYNTWYTNPSSENKAALEEIKRMDTRDDNLIRLVVIGCLIANTYGLYRWERKLQKPIDRIG